MKGSFGSAWRRPFGAALALGLVLFSARAWAVPPQEMGECDVPDFQGMRWNTVTTISGENRIYHFQDPTVRCPGGMIIQADSVRLYQATQYYQFWGNVRFEDPESVLTSDQAQYFTEQRRLVAQGNAVLTNRVDGSVITGHNMTMIRGERDGEEDLLTVQGGEPHATLYPTVQEEEPAVIEGAPPDSAMAAPDPGDAALGAEGVVGDTVVESALTQDTLAPDTLAPDAPVGDPVLQDSATVPMDIRVAEPSAAVAAGVAFAAAGTAAAGPGLTGIVSGITAVVAGMAAGASGPATAAADTAGFVPEADVLDLESAEVTSDTAAAGPDPMVAVPDSGLADPNPVERVPYEIDARRFVIEGSEVFRAIGNVVVTRDSLNASADSLDYAQSEGALFLSGNALVVTVDYALTADLIRLAIPQDEIREARATGDAILEGQDLQLVSPIVTLFFTDGVLDRLVAVRDPVADSLRAEMTEAEREQDRLARGVPPLAVRNLGFAEFPVRPFALAQEFALDGDSLEVLAPGEIIDEVRAIGNARGESMGQDSLNNEETPDLIASDWLEGDTIFAFFSENAGPVADTVSEDEEIDMAEDPEARPVEREREAEGPDSTKAADYKLEQLVASGNARSMYRMAPSDSTAARVPGRFAVHYVLGEKITILLNDAGEAEHMEVAGQTRGIHLEPLGGSQNMIDSMAVPDTAALGPGVPGTRPDTTGVVPDTTAVAPDTTRMVLQTPWAPESSGSGPGFRNRLGRTRKIGRGGGVGR